LIVASGLIRFVSIATRDAGEMLKEFREPTSTGGADEGQLATIG
jgi:hypothetical protein